ncbi:NYN domain-containing protein [Bacillota bacterium Meth-B3]|nr:NYN domain-containing protein [Christensenellaceae bacterium]MEA5066832.1 NYN domain-containing protein [Eubacteriales bacterium]MEA5068071.1 NYN domain-containing protein [Christensenellaceae bacterium]
MSTSKFAVFVDLENAGAKESMLNNIIEKVKIRGDILLGKVYGYTDRYTELRECLLSNTFSVVPSIRYGKAQKNNLDILLVIDALEVAYTNPLIDSFCIVSGDSDYTPLVGKLKSMGKHVLGISRSEVASGIFIKACNEFIFLESVASSIKKPAPKPAVKGKEPEAPSDLQELVTLVETVLADQDEDTLYASELKDIIMRLRPDFDERSYGFTTFGKLMNQLASVSPHLKVWTEDSSVKITLTGTDAPTAQLNKTNWLPAFTDQLDQFKQDGFERINPSILKGAIQAAYPDFEERQIGFKRFSDIMKRLEKEGLLVVEMDGAHTMLLKIC